MSGGRRVYLAGPEVFLPIAPEVLAAKAECARGLGFEPLLPVDESHPGTGHDVATRIYEGNRELIAAADLLVANLSPFRGPSADPGTVFEMGYAAGRGLPVLAYTTDPRVLADRVPWRPGADGALRDRDGLLVEDFGRLENLMPAVACERSGAAVIVAPGGDALAGLRECLRAAGGG
jgi:nucleoside 2-deoxyribosyltransferase